MRQIEDKLRAGMARNGFAPKTQDEVVQFITSFALYGFPESHAASFALLAYASAFLKVRYLAAFTASLLNNWPMGFYSPSTLVKDAQRHGLRVKPVDVTRSDWKCTIEYDDGKLSLRLGLRYVKGLSQAAGEAVVRVRKERPFISISDLALRVPELSRADFQVLARIGALNKTGGEDRPQVDAPALHRRDALWQSQKVSQPVGPLLAGIVEPDAPSPLLRMTTEERLVADYGGTGLSIDHHPLFYRRRELREKGAKTARDLASLRDGAKVLVAGLVITRQRPGTAKGFIFLSLEDETGIANAIITPDFYAKNTMTVLNERFVMIEGRLQNKENVIHVKAEKIMPLEAGMIETPVRNFH
jgi:error-prone DNA polymerase